MAFQRGTRVHGTLPRGIRRGTGTFALDVRAWVEKTKARADIIVQKISIDLLSSVIEMSPVGNPELWAANHHSIYGRQTHNVWVSEVNRQLVADPANLTRGGNLKRGVKKARKLSKSNLLEAYPLRAGKGYVGGRFKGNWQVAIGAPPSGETGRVDPSGNETHAAGRAVIATALAGNVIYLVNNVPYAIPLEYGWSSQAPAGMVRITVARFQAFVNDAVRSIEAEGA